MLLLRCSYSLGPAARGRLSVSLLDRGGERERAALSIAPQRRQAEEGGNKTEKSSKKEGSGAEDGLNGCVYVYMYGLRSMHKQSWTQLRIPHSPFQLGRWNSDGRPGGRTAAISGPWPGHSISFSSAWYVGQ